jgi:hypothetical protein
MIRVQVSQEAARQLNKMVELFASAILPNQDLLELVKEINLSIAKEATDAREKKAEGVRVPQPPPQRGGLVRSKRGENHFA